MTSILLVCANPRGTNPLRLGEEVRALRESVLLSKNRDAIRLETLNASTVDDLRRELLRNNYDIVHFSGHGTQKGLVFEDVNGLLFIPDSAALAELFERRAIKTVLLNACFSLSVGELASVGVDFTIATEGPIKDPAAIEFSRGFYDAIGAGLSIPDAYQEGIGAVKIKNFTIRSILLRHGEKHVAVAEEPKQSSARSGIGSQKVLLGIAVDASGSMQESIRNDQNVNLTRWASIQEALTKVGPSLSELELEPEGLRLFLYGFGLRIMSGFADLCSLSKALKSPEVQERIAEVKARYERSGASSAARYSGLKDLAKQWGFGPAVSDFERAAKKAVTQRALDEISGFLVQSTKEVGDTTVSPTELARILGGGGADVDRQMIQQVIFGQTPLTALSEELVQRFQREGSASQQKVLFLFSDGEPTDGDPKPNLLALKASGVSIVSCFVTGRDIVEPMVLWGRPSESWTSETRFMWDVASEIDESSALCGILLDKGWKIENGARLFVQVNHSRILNEFVQAVTTYLSSQERYLLPQGR